MPVEDAADRAGFLDVDEFATTAQWSPGDRWDPSNLDGIFEAAHAVVLEGGDEPGIGTAAPSFTFDPAGAPAMSEGDKLVVGGTTYKVAGKVEPDGTGMAVAHLHKA